MNFNPLNNASVAAVCIGAAKCTLSQLSQLSTVLEPQCWEAVVRNSLIGVAVAAFFCQRNSVIGSGCWAGNSSVAGAGPSLRAQRSHGKCIKTTFMKTRRI